MLRYTKTGFWGENLGTLENTKKNEVIPSYAKKKKNALLHTCYTFFREIARYAILSGHNRPDIFLIYI